MLPLLGKLVYWTEKLLIGNLVKNQKCRILTNRLNMSDLILELIWLGQIIIKCNYLQADLTPLFNWNVKQLFVYLTAEYTTPQNQVFRLIGQLRLKGTIEVFGVNWSFLRFGKSSLFATTCYICILQQNITQYRFYKPGIC
jgi:hypothetical protein